jgi:archaetidylinositol phosphate synthase
MIESCFRKTYQKVCIDPLLRLKVVVGLHPLLLTGIACLAGVGVLPLLAMGFPIYALILLAISGFLDTLDGSLARHTSKMSNLGAAMDIVSDRVVEFAAILGLFFVEPASRALPCLLMVGSVLICVTSFLIVGVFTQNSSEKSFHYSPGLIERAEAFVFFAAMIALPSAFLLLSYVFNFLVLLTAAIRLVQFSSFNKSV